VLSKLSGDGLWGNAGEALYSSLYVTGKIITVSGNPSRLNVVDPETGALQSVALTYVPLNVSVSPDGTRAAVGHDAYVSSVNLTTHAVDRTVLTSVVARDVVLAGNRYAYVFPAGGAQWTNVRSVAMATGTVTVQTGSQIYGGTVARLHSSGSHIYGAERGIYPSDFEKYDVRGGPAAYMYDSPYHGEYSLAATSGRSRTACASSPRAAASFAPPTCRPRT
jgi:hypothetical protein